MPLSKYFLFVGGALLATLTLANFLLEPSTGAKAISTAPQPVAAVYHDPQASRVERLRDEQRALQAVESGQSQQTAIASSGPVTAVADSKAPADASIPLPTPSLQAAPANLSPEVNARESAPASVVNAKETVKAARERKTRSARYRAKSRPSRRMFADGGRNFSPNPQRGFGAYGPQASAGRFGWGNGW
jgi:hypothetical protein